MSARYALLLFFIFAFTTSPLVSIAQKNVNAPSSQIKKNNNKSRLFDDDEIIHLKLTGRLNDLFNDRGDNSSFHPLLLQYLQKDSSLISINITAKTRGHFRRLKANCKMPPILLSFPKEGRLKNTLFEKQSKLKLVVPCQGDEYVIREWLVYKLYNLLSNRSFLAKLVQVDFEDSARQGKVETHYCFLLEDDKKVADRNQSFIWKKKFLPMRNVNADEFRTMAMFQYMIGNTDWSVPYLQNIVLISKDSSKAPYAIPYDFDHAGIVDAPYAGPAPELGITNIRERLYRGFCENNMKAFAKTIELFNQQKENIYNTYDSCTLLNHKYLKFVKFYLDDFFKTINSNKVLEKEFGKPCTTDIRVEIKGLKD